MRNGDTLPKVQNDREKDKLIYFLFKILSAVVSVCICAALIGVFFGSFDEERTFSFFYIIGLISIVSLVIVILIGLPISVLIDHVIKNDRGVNLLIKALLHGVSGVIVAAFIFGNSLDRFILISGFLNATVYYFVFVLLYRKSQKKRSSKR